MQNKPLKIVAMDPSMRNWGLAVFLMDPDDYAITVEELYVIRSNKDKKKAAKKSTRDIMTVEELLNGIIPIVEDADVIVAEIPIGGRDSAAALSYSICISIIATLNVAYTEVFPVTPHEVKMNVHKEATKAEMIEWATRMHPEAPWVYRTQKGKQYIVASFAEHVSDAIGALYAAASKPQFFKNIAKLLQEKSNENRSEIIPS